MATNIPPSLRPTRDLSESPALLEGAHIHWRRVMYFHGSLVRAYHLGINGELGLSGRHREKPVIDNTVIHSQCVSAYVICFRQLTQCVQ